MIFLAMLRSEAVNMTSDDVLAELDEMKEVVVLDPVCVRVALWRAGSDDLVEFILDDSTDELPFARTAILAALVDAAAQ